jgi:4-phospho-D-threonate 3-dehydrogenase / 4-phospho-D-erythronate 3-dehydrogenase
MRARLAITMGDINGIGPEVLARFLADRGGDGLLVVGDAAALSACAAGPLDVTMIGDPADWDSANAAIAVWDAGYPAPARTPSVLSAEAGRCSMEWTRAAVALAMDGLVDGIVTCPINKEGIRLAGYTAMGHTDFIASLTGAAQYRMSLFAGHMRAVHVSAHVPLRQAIDLLTTERIVETIRIADDGLQRLGIERGRIAVAGLNPHAGEGGMLGDEDGDIIAPAVAQCRAAGIDCSGPHSPDAVFRHMDEGRYDLVVAMYHDQGHVPLKLVAMDDAVNVTLGLPIVRTSVGHGTAYDIAGTGAASDSSLRAAVALAETMASASTLHAK